jgi:hypothetical protein
MAEEMVFGGISGSVSTERKNQARADWKALTGAIGFGLVRR